jgi:hypothetical protein
VARYANSNTYDVIVCGGGPSGFIAATAAARGGAKTLLIERYGFLGGMPTSAWLGPISPFHYGDERVVAGIPQEFVERMRDAGGSTGHIRCTNPHGSGAYLCFYDRESYKWTALQMLLEAGAEPLFHSFVADAVVEHGRVTGVVVANKSGRREIRAKVVVDATGDGDVAARAGAAHTVGRGGEDTTVQPVTMMFDMAGVDTHRVKQYMDTHLDDFEWASEFVALEPYSSHLQQEHFVGQGLLELVSKGLKSEELYLGRDSVLFLTTVHPGVLHFNSTRVAGIDGTSAESLTTGEIDARRQVMSLSAFLTKYMPGFEEAYLAGTGVQIGVRESRHVVGQYALQADDVVHGRKFEDVIARGYFPIDIHNVRGKEGYQGGGVWQDLDDSYDIPLRCLVPREMDGLVIAGRAISATHEAHGSFRTQGGVMQIGHAAGALAAMATNQQRQVRDVGAGDVQDLLAKQGASLHRDPQRVEQQKAAAEAAVQEALAEGRITGRYFPGEHAGTPANAPSL